jgi:hypothetical protein
MISGIKILKPCSNRQSPASDVTIDHSICYLSSNTRIYSGYISISSHSTIHNEVKSGFQSSGSVETRHKPLNAQ